MNPPFIHALSDVRSKDIGEGTRIWQFCVVLPQAKIGKNCNVCANCFIENDVVIGDNVTIKCGVQIWDGMRVEDNVFIGPNATFCNDRHPRSGNAANFRAEPVVVKQGAVIGANATILPGVTVGVGAVVGAGSVVCRSIGDGVIFMNTCHGRDS